MDYAVALDGVNWLAVAVATVAMVVVGSVWYADRVFGAEWMKAAGLKKKDLARANMTNTFGGMIIGSFLSAAALAVVFELVGVESASDGGVFAGLVATFFIATSYGINYLFEQRSLNLLSINAGYNIFGFVAMGVVLGAWN